MLENLACTCGKCDRKLDADSFMLVYRTDAGERRAYECGCGAVTITVSKEGE